MAVLTALELINRSFYNSQIVGKNFNTATNDQINDGLFYLNNILAEKTAQNALNPYYQPYSFTTEVGEEEYFVENLINIETLTFVYQTVRYACNEYSRTQYFQSFRANTVETLPLTYHVERGLGGATVFLYPLPNLEYEFTMWAQFGFTTPIALNTDLFTVYDRFYTAYLELELAARLCVFYGKQIPPGVAQGLARCEASISSRISPPDLTTTKTSTLTGEASINWAFVNFSNGWTVSGR